jgi:phage-related minor tail protein
MIFQAVKALHPNASFEVRNCVLVWKDSYIEKPTEEQIQAKIAELQAAEPMRQLRQQRNQLLQQSDWMAVSDRVMTQAQIDYRQALRDLPETADPQLDENGNLTNVTWPSYE